MSETKYSDCNKCYVKVNGIWNCWELYDGNTCPSYEKKMIELKIKRIYNLCELKAICIEREWVDILEQLQQQPDDWVFGSDGCSMWFDKYKDICLIEICWKHDLRYKLGGTMLDKLIADQEMEMSVAIKTKDIAYAKLMRTGVELGGNDTCFDLPFEWNKKEKNVST